MDTQQKISHLVAKGLPLLAPPIRDWTEGHLIAPRKVKLATDPDGKEYKEYWLVTDNNGNKDSSYRVVYDDMEESFGLECTLESGVEWFMGLYGEFSETVESM